MGLEVITVVSAVLAVALGVALVREVRSHKEAGVELAAARQFVELANDPILVADLARGRIVDANPAASELLGYTPKELTRLTVPELHPKALVSRSAEIVADVWEKRGLVYSELPFVTKDGQHIEVEVSARVFEFQGELAMLMFARDIRQRRQLESQLVQSEKMAALGQLVAGVAHEINTPIGSIHANADVMVSALGIVTKTLEKEEVAPSIQGNRRLERAMSILHESIDANRIASERIVDIVRSLRNFARLDEAERKTVDLHEGLDSTLTLLRHELKHGVEVVKEFGEIPKIDCFPNQLNQVFMNVLVNGVQAMDGSGTITITTLREGDEVLVKIADSGKGIPQDEIDRIFDPGFTTKGVGVGTGLGLSITFQIMEKHEGRVEVESEVGVGPTFTIRLPIR